MLPTTQYESKCLLRRLPKIDDGTVCLPPFLLTYSFPCFHYASSSSSSTSPSTSPSASSSSSSINKRIYIFIQWLNNYLYYCYTKLQKILTLKNSIIHLLLLLNLLHLPVYHHLRHLPRHRHQLLLPLQLPLLFLLLLLLRHHFLLSSVFLFHHFSPKT